MIDTLQMIFIPTEDCDLKCYYCSRGCHTNTDVYKCSLSEFEKLLDFVELQGKKYVDFQFFGGEPTQHPNLNEMAWMVNDRFGDKLIRLEISTNMIKPLDYFTGILWPDLTKFSCSYHSDSGDGDLWMNKVNILNEYDFIGDVKMVITPENEDYIIDLFGRHDNNNFRIYEMLPQEQMEGTEWADSLNDLYTEFDFDYIGEYRIRDSYKGMMCSTGFRVDQRGNVYYCWRKFNDRNSRPILNTFKEEPRQVSEWHLCSYDDCDINDVDFPKKTLKERMIEIKKS